MRDTACACSVRRDVFGIGHIGSLFNRKINVSTVKKEKKNTYPGSSVSSPLVVVRCYIGSDMTWQPVEVSVRVRVTVCVRALSFVICSVLDIYAAYFKLIIKLVQ